MRYLLCLLGFHTYKETYKRVGNHKVYTKKCIHCGAEGWYKE